MWCPKCKYEYVDGITVCADCNVALVPSLAEETFSPEDDFSTDVVSDNNEAITDELSAAAELAESLEQLSPEELAALKEEMSRAGKPSRTYISKKDQKEDMKSTAYTFTIVGFLGMVFLVLFELDMLPIHLSNYMKVMMGIVMGAMFIIFFVIGIRYFKALKKADSDATEEENTYNDIMTWFKDAYPTDAINTQIDLNESEEQLYFSRYEVMSHLISEKYPELDDAFLDHIVETLYNDYYA